MAAIGAGWGGGPWIGLVWTLVWVGVILGGIYLLRRGSPRERREPAETALAERYARGEIEEDEYRARLRVLRER